MSIFTMSFNSLNASYLPNIVKCLQTITMILEWAFPEPKIHCRSRRTIIQLRFHCWAFHEILLPIINVIVQFVSSIYWAILSSDFLATSIVVFWKSCECFKDSKRISNKAELTIQDNFSEERRILQNFFCWTRGDSFFFIGVAFRDIVRIRGPGAKDISRDQFQIEAAETCCLLGADHQNHIVFNPFLAYPPNWYRILCDVNLAVLNFMICNCALRHEWSLEFYWEVAWCRAWKKIVSKYNITDRHRIMNHKKYANFRLDFTKKDFRKMLNHSNMVVCCRKAIITNP